MRVGIGQDSHRLKTKNEKRKTPRRSKLWRRATKNLILGGVKISEKYYLEADSDGDVIIHSLCNALSTAIGGGSLDTWAGEMFKSGITDSREFLRKIIKKIKVKGYQIGNVAIMVEAGKPSLEGFRKKMQLSLAKLLEIEMDKVGIAFTTGEDLTTFGKGEGIEAFSIVSLI